MHELRQDFEILHGYSHRIFGIRSVIIFDRQLTVFIYYSFSVIEHLRVAQRERIRMIGKSPIYIPFLFHALRKRSNELLSAVGIIVAAYSPPRH